jgi:putative oxidoreductase
VSCIQGLLRAPMSRTADIMSRLPRAAVWALAILLALIFVLVGVSKLQGPSAVRWSERFANWGYPGGARAVVGALEILAGFGLLIPTSRRDAAAVLVALMVGAFLTHLIHGEFPRVVPPLVLGGGAILIYSWRTRPN